MNRTDIVSQISKKTGVEKKETTAIVDAFISVVKNSMCEGKNVYLRGFGTFFVKKRAEKPGRIFSKNTIVIIPAHNIPAFKPSGSFAQKLKTKMPVTKQVSVS